MSTCAGMNTVSVVVLASCMCRSLEREVCYRNMSLVCEGLVIHARSLQSKAKLLCKAHLDALVAACVCSQSFIHPVHLPIMAFMLRVSAPTAMYAPIYSNNNFSICSDQVLP